MLLALIVSEDSNRMDYTRRELMVVVAAREFVTARKFSSVCVCRC